MLVRLHRLVKGTSARERLVERGRTSFGVTERVTDPLRGDEIPVVASVADEHPSRSPRRSKVIQHGGAGDRSLAFGGTKTVCELRHGVEHLQEVALDVLLVRLELRVRPSAHCQCETVMCGGDGNAPTRSNISIEVALSGEVAPVRVIAAEQLRLLVVLFGPHALRDD